MLAQVCKLKFMCSLLYFDCSTFWLCLLFLISKIWSVTIYLKTKSIFPEIFLACSLYLCLPNSLKPLVIYLLVPLLQFFYSPSFFFTFYKEMFEYNLSSHICLFSGRKCTNHTRIVLSSYKWIIYRTFSQYIIHWDLMYTLVLLSCFIYVFIYKYRYVFIYKTIYEHIKTMHTDILYNKRLTCK